MGSSIGPGSNNQSISLSWNKGYNKIGVFVGKNMRYNNDFYYVCLYNSKFWNLYSSNET